MQKRTKLDKSNQGSYLGDWFRLTQLKKDQLKPYHQQVQKNKFLHEELIANHRAKDRPSIRPRKEDSTKCFILPEVQLPEKLELLTAILKRKSRREFGKKKVNIQDLAILLKLSFGDRVARPGGFNCVEAGVWVRRCERLASGFYIYDPHLHVLRQARSLEKIRWNEMKIPQGDLAIFLRLLPEPIMSIYGQRGLRHALISAGSSYAHLYLGAECLNLSCCGYGAYIDEVALTKQDGGSVMNAGLVVIGSRNSAKK